jgi:hypothetical protein
MYKSLIYSLNQKGRGNKDRFTARGPRLNSRLEKVYLVELIYSNDSLALPRFSCSAHGCVRAPDLFRRSEAYMNHSAALGCCDVNFGLFVVGYRS